MALVAVEAVETDVQDARVVEYNANENIETTTVEVGEGGESNENVTVDTSDGNFTVRIGGGG
ncbi:MAG: hypothetical protein SXQ77_03720 [Halobacteria archaeon]|nr:hypothetical protein [Halobacteria archaeon]